MPERVVAHIEQAGAATRELCYGGGIFSVAGRTVSPGTVATWEDSGHLTWVDADADVHALVTAARVDSAETPGAPATAWARIPVPLARLVLFVVAFVVFSGFWGFNIPYAVVAVFVGIPSLVLPRRLLDAPGNSPQGQMTGVFMFAVPVALLVIMWVGAYAPTRRRFLILFGVFVALLLLSLAGCYGAHL